MTISTTTNRVSFTGNGVSTSFSFPYFVIAAADIKVYQKGTLKTLTTHYTLSGSAPYTSGTNVQFVTAPAVADEIVILRDPAITQAVDITDNDPLPAASIETPLDRLTMICQRLADRISRAFTLSDSDVSGASLTLPTPAASKLIGWDSAGTALANYASSSIAATIVPSAFMETVLDDTTAAAARTTLGAFASAGGTISGDTIVQGDVTISTAKALIYEGATADAFETTLGVVDPTADRTILLPDASGTLAFTATASNAIAGSVVQVVHTPFTDFATTSVAIPYDNSIPQNTEGGEFMTRAITPNSATNKLKITVVLVGGETSNVDTQFTVALFQDSTADALAAVPGDNSDTNNPYPTTFVHYMTAGTTSSTTFKVRAGNNSATAFDFNGHGGTRLYGGVCASSITIEEIKV